MVEVDELLKDATENNPDLRPDIHEFTKKLLLWREIADDFDKSQNSDWKFLTKQLFGKMCRDLLYGERLMQSLMF